MSGCSTCDNAGIVAPASGKTRRLLLETPLRGLPYSNFKKRLDKPAFPVILLRVKSIFSKGGAQTMQVQFNTPARTLVVSAPVHA
jgi:hypothetical protein